MYSFVGCDGSICFWQEIEELVSYFVNMHWKIVKIYFESKGVNTCFNGYAASIVAVYPFGTTNHSAL